MYDYSSSLRAPWYDYIEQIKVAVISDGITTIGNDAFYNCKSLINITIPSSVLNIGYWAFGRCSSLINITIPDNVTSINKYTFYKCTSLTNIAIPNSVVYIDDNAFQDCTNLASVNLPNSVTSIGDEAFRYCTNLASITIPYGVTSIGVCAFDGCTSLTSVSISESVISIGASAFRSCKNLPNITIPYSIKSIGAGAFEDSRLTSINVDKKNTYYSSLDGVLFDKDVNTIICYPAGKQNLNYVIPNSVTSIGAGAFEDSRLTSIKIPNSVTSIGGGAFEGSSLTSITIPNSVKDIGSMAFQVCYYLKHVTIPDSVTSINYYTFGGCTDLTSIIIPKSVTSITNNAFDYCYNLTIYSYIGSNTEIYANNKNINFVALDGNYKYTDINTDISLNIAQDAELSVEKLTENEKVADVIAVLDMNEKLIDLYDISLTKDGKAVQPDGTATVKIPTNNENTKVYRIEDNSTATDMNAVYDNGYMVFTTDHFSLYALVVPNENVMGDANSDGLVNAKDRMMLTRCLAKWSGYEDINTTAADVNKDGAINAKDRMILTRHLAKWQGYENLPYTS